MLDRFLQNPLLFRSLGKDVQRKVAAMIPLQFDWASLSFVFSGIPAPEQHFLANFSPSRNRLVSCGSRGGEADTPAVCVWSYPGMECLARRPMKGARWACFHDSGDFIAAGSDTQVMIFFVAPGKSEFCLLKGCLEGFFFEDTLVVRDMEGRVHFISDWQQPHEEEQPKKSVSMVVVDRQADSAHLHKPGHCVLLVHDSEVVQYSQRGEALRTVARRANGPVCLRCHLEDELILMATGEIYFAAGRIVSGALSGAL